MITEFYIFGYETVQYNCGFRSIDVEVYEFAKIPGKEGQCFIEKDCDRYFVRGWINKKGEIKG